MLMLNAGCAATLNFQKRWEGRKHFDSARTLKSKGDYAGALKENEKIVGLFPFVSPGDEALFNIALLWAHPDNPKKNYAKALEFFQQLLLDYPHSVFKEEASVYVVVIKELIRYERDIQALKATIAELEYRLKTLKEIDINIEEKRRSDFP